MTDPFEKLKRKGEVLKDEPSEVIHSRDDLDSGPGAHHHTLGLGVNQAYPGSAHLAVTKNLLTVARGSAQLVATGVETSVLFDNITEQVGGGLQYTAGNFTVDESGVYQFNVGLRYDFISASFVYMRLSDNAAGDLGGKRVFGPVNTTGIKGMFLSATASLTPSDVITLLFAHNTGSSQNIYGDGNLQDTWAQITRLA